MYCVNTVRYGKLILSWLYDESPWNCASCLFSCCFKLKMLYSKGYIDLWFGHKMSITAVFYERNCFSSLQLKAMQKHRYLNQHLHNTQENQTKIISHWFQPGFWSPNIRVIKFPSYNYWPGSFWSALNKWPIKWFTIAGNRTVLRQTCR